MRKIYTLFLLTLFCEISFAQNIEIHKNGVATPTPSLTIDSLSTVEYATAYYYIVNTSGSDLDVTWSRVRRAHHSSITDQICDDILCFDAADQTVYNRPLNFTIAAGDSSVFQPKVWPGDVAACAIYTYNIYTGLGSLEDSIQIKYKFDSQDCFLSDDINAEISYKTYPNPASDIFNIEVVTNGNDVQLVLFNVLGERVKNQFLIDGKNIISLSGMNDGVYFYAISRNGEIVETKKLVVKQ